VNLRLWQTFNILFAALLLMLAAIPAHAVLRTGDTTVGRISHTASALPDGRVLLVGGVYNALSASTEIYDPASGRFTAAAPTLFARSEHIAVTLADGRILVMGGRAAASPYYLASAEIYDPASGTWSATGNMLTTRRSTAAVLLADGRVLIVGGGPDEAGLASSEIYDPATGTFSASASLPEGVSKFALARLNDGRVLLAGGLLYSGAYTNRALLWNPASGTWSATGPMATGRWRMTAVLLANGKVLVAGGAGASVRYANAELFDPVSASFSATGSLTLPVADYTALRMNDGSVLVSGGWAQYSGDRTIQRYDPATQLWRNVGNMIFATAGHSTTELPDGRVLIAGAQSSTAAGIYDPLCGTSPNLLSSYVQSYSDLAASGMVSLSVPAACAWDIDPPPSWVTLSSAATGTGSTDVRYAITRNTDYYARATSLRIGGQYLRIEQARRACDTSLVPVLSPASQDFLGSEMFNGTFNVSTDSVCSWTIQGVPSWVTITQNASGSGSLTVRFNVAANPGPARTANLVINNAVFTVNQAQSSACDSGSISSVFPPAKTMPSQGGTGSFSVSYPAACSWIVMPVPSWMTITSGMTGQGSGVVTFSVTPNTGAARSHQVIAAKTYQTINQEAPCDTSGVTPVTLPAKNFTSAGGTGTVAITYPSTCSWAVTGLPSWITISSGASGKGNGTVYYTVAANGGAARSTVATFVNNTQTISQDQYIVSAACQPIAINPGVATTGTLTTGSCTTGARGSGYYTNRYSFNAVAGQKISIQLNATAFDAYLYLKNTSGAVLTSNDDGGGGTNSRIPATSGVYTLPAVAGTYVFEVTTYSAGATGAYTVTLN
jgi:hypothetical protein